MSPGRLRRAGHAMLWWCLGEEGSTRGLALLRIAVALMLWARLADQFLLHGDSTPAQVGLALAFHLGVLGTLLGLWTRLSTALAGGIALYGFEVLGHHQGQPGWGSHNIHLLVVTAALLALTPAGRSLSLDRWRALATGRPAPEQAPLWSFRLLGLFVASVYLSTFANKTDLAWLSGARLAAILGVHYTGSALPRGDLLDHVIMAGAVGVWALEGLLVFGLAIPRLRGPLALAGIALHGSFYAMFRVFTFSANMVVLYLPFFPPAQVHALIDRLCPPGADAGTRPVPQATSRRVARAAAMALALALLVAGAAWERAGAPPPLGLAAGPAVQLLAGREAGLGRAARDARRERVDQARREMQRWRDP